MGWDEELFHFGLKASRWVWRSLNPSKEVASFVDLASQKPRLRLIVSALTGEAVEIKEAEGVGGFQGGNLFLPARMASEEAYLYRTIFSVGARKLGLHDETGGSDPGLASLATILAVPAVHVWMFSELPRCRELTDSVLWQLEAPVAEFLARAKSLSPEKQADIWRHARELCQEPALRGLVVPDLWGILLPAGSNSSARRDPLAKEGVDSLPSGTEKQGKARQQVSEVSIEENTLEENPVTHVFEKLQTADEYQGGNRTPDGADELSDHQDALDEVNIRKVVRSRQKTRSVYRADIGLDAEVQEAGAEEAHEPSRFQYDEWDAKRRRYLKDWCTVLESVPSSDLRESEIHQHLSAVLGRHRGQARRLRARLENLLITRTWRNGQMDGPEIDIEALVDRYATWKSGHSPPEKLYQIRKRRERDLATLILIDSSLSTDSWVQGNRVLDVARDSVLILGDVLEGLHDQVAIGSFHSNTRRDCRYLQIKDFDEGWASARRRLMAIEPAGYTRIGPAIRHATHLLNQERARKKFLLLISDGKPTDYDRYEGAYGISDIRQAIREANEASVHVQALAVDSQAKFYLPRMFGNGNFQILPHPQQLCESLARTYATLLR